MRPLDAADISKIKVNQMNEIVFSKGIFKRLLGSHGGGADVFEKERR